jgi:hypothetical protein
MLPFHCCVTSAPLLRLFHCYVETLFSLLGGICFHFCANEGIQQWRIIQLLRYRGTLICHSITENIYYSQLSSVAILLQPEPNCFTSYSTRKWLFSLPLCYRLSVSPASHVSTSNGQWSSQLFCVHHILWKYSYDIVNFTQGGYRCSLCVLVKITVILSLLLFSIVKIGLQQFSLTTDTWDIR